MKKGWETVSVLLKDFKIKKEEILLNEKETFFQDIFCSKRMPQNLFLQTDGTEATRYIAFENNFASNLVGLITGEGSEEYIQALESTEYFIFISGTFKVF